MYGIFGYLKVLCLYVKNNHLLEFAMHFIQKIRFGLKESELILSTKTQELQGEQPF